MGILLKGPTESEPASGHWRVRDLLLGGPIVGGCQCSWIRWTVLDSCLPWWRIGVKEAWSHRRGTVVTWTRASRVDGGLRVFPARKSALGDSTRAPGAVCSPLTRQKSFCFRRAEMAEFERDALPLAPNHFQATSLHGCPDVFHAQNAFWRCYYCLHAGGPTRCIVRVNLGPEAHH